MTVIVITTTDLIVMMRQWS